MVFYFHKTFPLQNTKPLSKRAQRAILTCSWISFGLMGGKRALMVVFTD